MMLKMMMAFVPNAGRLCADMIEVQRSASTMAFSTYSTMSMMIPATMPPRITRPRFILPMVSPPFDGFPILTRPVADAKSTCSPTGALPATGQYSIRHAHADAEEAADDAGLREGWIVVHARVIGGIERRLGVKEILDRTEQLDIRVQLVSAGQVEIPERRHAAIRAERIKAERQCGGIWPKDVLPVFVNSAR